MNINIVGMAYSGQALDAELLQHQLEEMGHHVQIATVQPLNLVQKVLMKTGLHRMRRSKFDLNIFIQQPRGWWMPLAKKSVIVPNPDWIDDSELKNFKELDVIWCKTSHAMSLFSKLGYSSRFLGFTSPLPRSVKSDVVRNPWGCLHVAGSSALKGTVYLIDEWKKKPQWPVLTILSQIEMHADAVAGIGNIRLISKKIPADDVTYLRASHGIHIQMSETEGYGHVISESMGSGGVVVTLDAEPMNELINERNGFLVRARRVGRHYLADRFAPISSDFQNVMDVIFSCSAECLMEKSTIASEGFSSNKNGFENNLRLLLSELT